MAVNDAVKHGATATGTKFDPWYRIAVHCLDWSERRPHLGGALGAALLDLALRRRWVQRDLDSRALGLTASGRRELQLRFGLEAERCA